MAMETVLITGASSGIGLELAKLFAADKSNLVLVARNQQALEKLAEELRREHGVEVVVSPKDLADPATPQAIYDHLVGCMGSRWMLSSIMPVSARSAHLHLFPRNGRWT